MVKKYGEPQITFAKTNFYVYIYTLIKIKCKLITIMSNITEEQLLNLLPDEDSCLRHLENTRWNGIIISPFSQNSKVYYCANGKYKCRDSGKYFNAKTGTIFHNSRIPLQKWFVAIWIMAIEKNAITSVDMAKKLGITQKTAWYMMQRLREHFNLKKTATTYTKRTLPSGQTTSAAIAEADKLKMIDWLNMLKK